MNYHPYRGKEEDMRDRALMELRDYEEGQLEAIFSLSSPTQKFFGTWCRYNPLSLFASESTLENASDYRAARIILKERKNSFNKTTSG